MQTWQQLAGTGHLGAPASGVEDIVQHDDQHDQILSEGLHGVLKRHRA